MNPAVCTQCKREIEHRGIGKMWCGNCGWRSFSQILVPQMDTTVLDRSSGDN